MRLEKIKAIHQVLELASSRDWSGEINHAFARNLMAIRPLMETFHQKNRVRIETHCRKNDKGQKITKDGQWDFGDNQELADREYQNLLDIQVDFKPYQIIRSPETDKLPAVIQAELLNIIILLEIPKAS